MKAFHYCKIACLVYVNAVSFVAIICVYILVYISGISVFLYQDSRIISECLFRLSCASLPEFLFADCNLCLQLYIK